MLEIIRGRQVPQKQSIMEAVWRFRHQCFVDELGWEALRQSDGRERDAFDTQSTIHLVLTEENEVVGYSRLLPTMKPHLLSHLYPELIGEESYPRGRQVFEWGRCATARHVRHVRGIATADVLMTAVLEFLVFSKIETVIIQTNPALVKMIRRRGYRLEVLREPVLYEGEPVMVIAAYPSFRLLQQHRKAYGIDQSLLSVPSRRARSFAITDANHRAEESSGSWAEAE
ncbi:acyl-homoserine lactone synthase [Rhizobium petrolearium]|uniref:acyl-homoserine-lactone synthase n=1 Tax=Neorhizobium petrolearium TaxID=515361 RepID=UPI001AE1121C|nr:acyl-homoserine-lactone synthase [Neorhizobium petrolearium]MBP1844388.1 acyl-homoserine lactone synthase [Neorhizobium petrolearium]